MVQRRGLADHLALASDPRNVRGVRHMLTSLLLAVAVAVLLAGRRSFTAAGEWVADAPPQVVASLEYAVIRLPAGFEPPDDATICRVLAPR